MRNLYYIEVYEIFLDIIMHQQLKKEGRKNEHEMHKLLDSNQRLKKVNLYFFYNKMLWINHLMELLFPVVATCRESVLLVFFFLLLVLHRKNMEAFMATKRLRQLLESRKALLHKKGGQNRNL